MKYKLLVVGDWHLRGNNPRNRTDDYPEAAKAKLGEVFKLAAENGVTAILQPGDIFDRPEVSIAVLLDFAVILRKSPVPIICTIGNHDIYGYNVDSFYRTSLRLLEMLVPQLTVIGGEVIEYTDIKGLYITASPYSRKMDVDGYGYSPDTTIPKDWVSIHIAHGMLLDHTPPFDRFTLVEDVDTKANVVITGHDHIGYGIRKRKDGVVFLNPGSLLRASASVSEIERTPQVYFLDVDTTAKTWDGVTAVKLECAKPGEEVLDRSAIEEAKERQYAMEQFSTLIQGHTGGKVLLDINQIIDQIAEEEKFAPKVVQTALQLLDVQREQVVHG